MDQRPERQGRAGAGPESPQRDLARDTDCHDSQGCREDDAGFRDIGRQIAQVIRSEYVMNVPVEILGKVGPERIQVTGAFRPTDALIVSSSVPLLPGTLVRFSQSPSRGIEGTTPNPASQGVEAGITPPGRALGRGPPSAAGAPRLAVAGTEAPRAVVDHSSGSGAGCAAAILSPSLVRP